MLLTTVCRGFGLKMPEEECRRPIEGPPAGPASNAIIPFDMPTILGISSKEPLTNFSTAEPKALTSNAAHSALFVLIS
jgi:hypothetical protein